MAEQEITYSIKEALEKIIGQHENGAGDQELVDHYEDNGTVEGSMTFLTHVLTRLLEMDTDGALKLGEATIKYEGLETTNFEWDFTK